MNALDDPGSEANARPSATERAKGGPVETVIVVADELAREPSPAWLTQSNCYVIVPQTALDWNQDSAAGLIVVVIDDESALPTDPIRRAVVEETAPPILVRGPAGSTAWRRAALDAGALACFSNETAVEDQQSLFAAAARYHAAQRQIASLRAEANRICDGLLKNYGSAAEQLLHAHGEAGRIREDLEEVRTRILRAFI